MTTCPYGFRIAGATSEARRLITWAAAFDAYAMCDERAETKHEAYLSAFTFDDGLTVRADKYGQLDVAGYGGICAAPYIWFDIDRGSLDDALESARRLATTLDERFSLPDNGLLAFFSGAKGFHLGLPTMSWSPTPAVDFHRTARRFAESLAAVAGITIDTGVYDKVRAFRAPNSRHPKSSRFKRYLTLDELMNLSLHRITQLAEAPAPFEVPTDHKVCEQAALDWQAAADQVRRQADAVSEWRAKPKGATLNRSTLDFIRDGADAGNRHRLLFSAAANLAEFGCSSALAHALLDEAGRDCGLAPKEVFRQIECGLRAPGANHG